MGADLSRIRSNPLLDTSGVEIKQGGVGLDADFNEMVAVTDRRLRAAASDILGRSTVSSTTPDAFKITPIAGPDLTIGTGRLYVDGLLAECHGAASTDPAKLLFDPLLAEPLFADLVAYTRQPYLPAPPSLPGAGRHLVYLDVWEREVTHLERPDLVEVAVGVETSSRKQTVWQVRVLTPDAGTANCGSPGDALPGWADLIAPSTGRLTTGTFDMPLTPDPCELPPTGGYRGLENQAYRVEIHDPGKAGAATFKWSRENSSVGSRVGSVVSPTELELQSLGRDDVLRFNAGDWVEITDDVREFSQQAGEVRQITVNEAARRITFALALPGAMLPAAFPSSDFPRDRNLRVRRWDQKHKVLQAGSGGATTVFQDLDAAGGTGVITVPPAGTTLLLESGVTVTFDFGTKGFRAGDFWVFAARTADASVEPLVNAPPRGIHHHYERLALWDVSAGTVTDCRHPWSPRGCCTEVVYPGEDIQAAIAALQPLGGCVCLKMGEHHIGQPLSIQLDNVTVHGEVPWVTVVLDQGGPLMLEIKRARNVSVEGILFRAPGGRGGEAIIALTSVTGGRIADCRLELTGEIASQFPALGIQLDSCHGYAIENVQMANLSSGVVGQGCGEIGVRDCHLVGPKLPRTGEVTGLGAISAGVMGIQFTGVPGTGVCIERNTLQHYQRGVQLGDIRLAATPPAGGPTNPLKVDLPTAGSRIADNLITRQGLVNEKAAAFAIAVHVPRCEIVANAMNIQTLQHYGILVAGGNTLVHRNEVRSTAAVEQGALPPRIPAGVVAIETLADALLCSIRGNLFTGLQQAVVALGATGPGSPRVDVLDNRIAGEAALVKAAQNRLPSGNGGAIVTLLGMLEPLGAIVITALRHCRIADNEITTVVCGVAGVLTPGTSVVANRITDSLAGVVLVAADECEVADNVIASPSEGVRSRVGINLLVLGRSAVARNVLNDSVEGILTLLCTAVRVQDNDVYRSHVGIASLIDVDLEIRGNCVEDAVTAGIAAGFSFHELTVAHNRALRCGSDPGKTAAVGIEVLLAIALVTVEGCHVIDTGEAALASNPQRLGIQILWAIGARIRGCEVASRPLLERMFNPTSRAVRMWMLPKGIVNKLIPDVGSLMTPFADATDNVLEQSVALLVEVLAFGEATFATNRCLNFVDGNMLNTILSGSQVTLTGNRIRSNGGLPAVIAVFGEALAAVGNMTSNGGLLLPTTAGLPQVPAVYGTLNTVI